jgi:nicotinate-nucleotide adenylyltransferase
MRIGLFGGTFNPVHFGHLRAALEVRENFDLDEVILIPAALPPHKIPVELADAADRMQMLNLALEDVSGLRLSDVEIKRSGPSYTIDTVQYLRQVLPDQSRIYLIVGIDAFLEIDTWKSYNELLEQIPFIVISRPNTESCSAEIGWQYLEDYVKSKISEEYAFSESRNCFRANNKKPICVYEATGLDISSTRIRNLISRGRSTRFLVPRKVADFIQSKGLYK